MRRSQSRPCQIDPLEPRVTFSATWVVIPPGVGEPVVEQAVPDAAVAGLLNAAARATAGAGDVGAGVCWLVRFDKPTD
jgi:hypothetical protein